MPKAVDQYPQSRSVGNSLYNPLRSGVASYEDPLSAIGDDMEGIGREIGGLFSALGKIFGLPSPVEILAGVANGIGAVVAGATELITGFGGFFGRLIGGLLDGSQIPILDPTKILNLPAILKSFWNGWLNRSDGTGSPAEVTYVVEAIRDAVLNGYTVKTFTVDTVAWPVPPAAERLAMLIGGGQSGASSGAGGGLHGSFVMAPIDLSAIAAIDVQVGTAGNLSYIRAAAGTAHTGTILAQSPIHGSPGGIAEGLAYKSTTSLPGSGGSGGVQSTSTPAQPGESTPAAIGGARGSSGTFGLGGDPGGSVSAGAQIKCGGAGGGGGGYARAGFQTAGNGGAGGYPGGGGGGRGTAVGTGFPGTPGPGAPGVVWLAYK